MKPFGVVYKITNTITNTSYIGQTTLSIAQRWKQHQSKRSGCTNLYRAIKKHGCGAFQIEQLAVANNSEELNQLEMMLIASNRTLAPNGYNLDPGGDCRAHCDETRKRLSKSHKTSALAKAHRERLAEARRGKIGPPHSDESRRKIADSQKNSSRNAQLLRKMAAANRGRALSEEHRRKLSVANQGKRPSEETLRKLSESHKNSARTQAQLQRLNSRVLRCLYRFFFIT